MLSEIRRILKLFLMPPGIDPTRVTFPDSYTCSKIGVFPGLLQRLLLLPFFPWKQAKTRPNNLKTEEMFPVVVLNQAPAYEIH